MAMLPDKMFEYVIASLEGTPTVVQALLDNFGLDGNSERFWDARPEPDRFTIREVLAHMADWDEIFLHRLQRMMAEDNPVLPDIDEGRIAVERDYAGQSVRENVARLKANRARLVQFAQALTMEQRARPGQREKIGPLTAEVQLAFITAHDGYHTRQLAEYHSILA